MKLFSKDIFAYIGNVQTENLAGYLQIYIRKYRCGARWKLNIVIQVRNN